MTDSDQDFSIDSKKTGENLESIPKNKDRELPTAAYLREFIDSNSGEPMYSSVDTRSFPELTEQSDVEFENSELVRRSDLPNKWICKDCKYPFYYAMYHNNTGKNDVTLHCPNCGKPKAIPFPKYQEVEQP